jgi:two-component system, chemotaxis family, sensor kinase CheA
VTPRTHHSRFSIVRLRTLILIALVIGVGTFTGVMLTLVNRLSDRFGPQVRADLEWRALRGANELAKSVDVGLAVGDPGMIRDAFGVHTGSSDVRAIVAVDEHGAVIARHGEDLAAPALFAAPAGTVESGPGYLASWAAVEIEGAAVGKVAIAVSTARLTESEATLANVSRTTWIAGVLALVVGAVVIAFFTRAVSVRDHQLHDYAANLERKVEDRTRELDERNRGMRLVLDNVAQGFITIDTAGRMAAERSAIVDTWLGEQVPDRTFADAIRGEAPEFAVWLELGLDMLRDGDLPTDVCLSQLPARYLAHARAFDVAYTPIVVGDQVERILVIISDVTEQLARERAEREQRELLAVFQRITHDRSACEQFMTEATELVELLEAPTDRDTECRAIHTLKGNCGMFGFDRYAELCHSIEGELADIGPAGRPSDEQRAALVDGWRQVVRTMSGLLGEHPRSMIEVEISELSRVVDQARRGVSSRDLATVLASWAYEPVARRFDRLGKHAVGLSRRLGKGDLAVDVVDSHVRLDSTRWAPFWNALIHAVRNAIDHGIEPADQRTAAGKGRPRLTFAASQADGDVAISIADDGRGIDWEAVRERARRGGLPHATHRDLVDALLSDGLTTRDEATATSGRGVGLAALRSVVHAEGGAIDVESTPGAGTRFTFRFAAEPPPPALGPPTQPVHITREPSNRSSATVP